MSTTQTSETRFQWRTLAEAESGFAADPPDEFPEPMEEPSPMDRRHFLQLFAASAALAGTACTRQPLERIVPYVKQPEELTPGVPLFFATATELGGVATGLLVRSDEGRPTKIEGNPLHPASHGRTGIHAQAALLDLYDPDRSQTVRHRGEPATWEDFLGALLPRLAEWKANGGAGLHFLARRRTSPTLRSQIDELLARFPQARWHEYDAAFGARSTARPHFDQAEVILSLDADLFGPGGLDAAATFAFAQRRRSAANAQRLYVVESMPSLAGAMADHRRALPPRGIAEFARSLTEALQHKGSAVDGWSQALLHDLESHRGKSLVLAGEFQSQEMHDLARVMNQALGNVGVTIDYAPPEPTTAATLAELAQSLHRGDVKALFILGGNPVYDTPADLEFASAVQKAGFTLHHGLYLDETATSCEWHVPASHFLEAWSDVGAVGLLSIVQPLIEPLYPSKSAHELLAAMLGQFTVSGYEIVRAGWQKRLAGADFESAWRKALHDGLAASNDAKAPVALPESSPAGSPKLDAASGGLELIIRPDPHVLDGRFANNGWLQELPHPFTKLTWGNAAHLSPATARELKIGQGDVLELRYRGRSVSAPAWILPGHADRCVTLHLGFGRTNGGRAANGVGFNAFALQTADAPWGGNGLEVRKTGAKQVFATTQEHQRMAGRAPVRVVEGEAPPHSEEATPSRAETLYPPVKYAGPAWGMVIDLDACIGCSVCTIACQAENNIPVVGREQVLRGREMHWIRVDSYFAGSPEAPRFLHQPVPCMHCENAPCEVVCPVAATVHDHEGLNLMVYNRCVGTRYCSNNCPYKVRRFNFFAFTDDRTPQLKLMRNPGVTVRGRGVMEKCSYCVQRIHVARITADKENRPIADGEVVPACAQACPADAIAFGDILDPQSRVAAWRKDVRHYELLGELNTRPRTTYLARRRNLNSEMPA